MSRLQTIENRLKEINGTVFQELCDSYLTIRDSHYVAISRTGSQTGKQKTTKGTPDTFYQLSNGNFLYSEITTDKSTKDKLKNDIKACFNPKQTKISIDKIEKIVLCFNWNINQEKIVELNELAQSYKSNIKLRFLMLQELAIELHLNHRDLAHQYLSLPLDTGQIVSLDTFIQEYGRASKGIATPLDNTFLHRDVELQKLSKAIDDFDFIVLTGAPGVGKTKLAIQSIRNYLTNNESYQAYCVSYKNHTLLDDLYQYFDVNQNFLLFVDDANRIDAFEQITGFFKANRTGKLKIIITVRDYAFQEIGIKCQEFSTQRIDLKKMTDEQIIDIIKIEPFGILNPDYHKEIVRISDGNPRIAIMTSLLAKKEQNLYALHDVSDLFEKYFSTFIRDNREFQNQYVIKCLGIISFFYTIPYKNIEITESILEKFDISYHIFIDTIDKLDMLELVEIQFEHVKVPEQNFATFFFYKAFISDSLISFNTLLLNYYDNYTNRFKDSIIPANNTFGPQNVMNKIKPELLSYWNLIKENEHKAFTFLNVFWFYLQDQALEFGYQYILDFPKSKNADYSTFYENNQFNYNKDKIIELFGNFFRFSNEHLRDSLEILFEYAFRLPEKLPEIIHKIREILLFDKDDEHFDFFRQKTLFDFLRNGTNRNDELLTISFYELSNTFLAHSFQQFKGGRSNSIIHYQYQIPSNKTINDFRKKIWKTINDNFQLRPVNALVFLNKYAKMHPDNNKEIMEYDISFILEIIDKHLDKDNFEHCKYVQEQIRCFKQYGITFPDLKNYANRYINETYRTYLKLDWNRFRDKEIYDFEDFREYDRLKESEIRNTFIFSDIDEIDIFMNTFILLKNSAENNRNYNNVLDLLIDENFIRDPKYGLILLSKTIERDKNLFYVPRITFRNHLKTEEMVKEIWRIIQENNFNSKALWELSYYDYIDSSFITHDIATSIEETINRIPPKNTIYFDSLRRFIVVEPNLFPNILRIITNRNERENAQLLVWMDFFSKHFDKLGTDIALIKKAYFQQYSLQNHFDYEGKGFLEIQKADRNFLYEFIEYLYLITDRHSLGGDHSDMSYIWNIEEIENILPQVFDLIIKKDSFFGILEHFCNVFFRKIVDDSIKKRSEDFIKKYVIENNSDYKKMQIVVDLVRHSRRELFEEIFLLYISLNQDSENFGKLMWRGNGGTYRGDVIVGDIQAAEWKELLEITKKSELGIKLIPIKTYINEQIESSLRSGDWERQRKFLSKDF